MVRVDLAREADRIVQDLEMLLSADNPDEEQALRLASQIGELRTQQFERLVRSVLDIRETLTPEQMSALKMELGR